MKTRRAFDAAEDQRRVSDLPMFAPAISRSINQKRTDSKARRELATFEERRPTSTSLTYVRAKLLEVYHQRERLCVEAYHFVTADDAARILEEWTEFPNGGSQNWRGAIFRKGWERLEGDVPSLRASHNGTPLARWRPRA